MKNHNFTTSDSDVIKQRLFGCKHKRWSLIVW